MDPLACSGLPAFLLSDFLGPLPICTLEAKPCCSAATRSHDPTYTLYGAPERLFDTALLLSILSASSLLLRQEDEAARAYDRSLVRLRGITAATNFALSDYKHDLQDYHAMQQVCAGMTLPGFTPCAGCKTGCTGCLQAPGCCWIGLPRFSSHRCGNERTCIAVVGEGPAAVDVASHCPRMRSCPAAVGAAE